MKHASTLGAVALAALYLGCSANDGTGGDTGGGLNPGSGGNGGSSSAGSSSGGSGILIDGGNSGGSGGSSSSNCASGAEWIYLLDSDETLLQFRPDSLTLSAVGTLACPAGFGASPFSMSVDRGARAWVLYNDGSIYNVSTVDASCTATNFTPNQQGLSVFGMGFAANGAGSADETLFIAGGSSVGAGSATLAWLDTNALAVNAIAQINGWPELTGTGDGELWGFAPDTSPPTIRNFDKTSGAALTTYNLQGLANASYSAWAFAFWGGSFYVFLNDAFSTTNIWRYDPTLDSLTNALPDIGYRIVGAGVSTCAPVEPPR